VLAALVLDSTLINFYLAATDTLVIEEIIYALVKRYIDAGIIRP
jgi:hypothetical protein